MRLASEATIRTQPPLGVFADVGSIAVKQENAQLRVTADELSHRIKNLVAIIQSIARQTMHQTTTKEDFEVRFSNRLGAFGRALDLLIANDWRGARIDDLVRSELTPFGVQVSVKGPPLALKPDAARNIGLALHELATNASKYGALSVPEGKVAVHWGLASSSGRPRFRVTWRESGGPMVTEPTRRGFGRQIIQEVTAHALAGKVTHEFLPAGVRWTLDMPAAFVVSARRDLASTAVEGRRSEGRRHVSQ